jgi:hypothetical protein
MRLAMVNQNCAFAIYHMCEALSAALAEADGKEVLSRRLHAEVRLRLMSLSDAELWELAKMTAYPPEMPVELVYENHKREINELRTTAAKWVQGLLRDAVPDAPAAPARPQSFSDWK